MLEGMTMTTVSFKAEPELVADIEQCRRGQSVSAWVKMVVREAVANDRDGKAAKAEYAAFRKSLDEPDWDEQSVQAAYEAFLDE